jgi:acetyltransferase-like isoleucine patch superfamily enzyme
MEKILTICIPTYNRSKFLEICLDSVFQNINGLNNYIDVIVSDNCSIDDTKSIINKFRARGNQFEYYCQDQNLGTEKNFEFLYNKVVTKYFWIIGDDDFILPNRVEYVLEILKNNDLGLLYLHNYWYDDLRETENITFSPQIEEYYDCIEFISKVNYWITFLSANIINKSIHVINNSNYHNTMLDYVKWYLPTIFAANKNIILSSPVVACKTNNSGGYNLYKVFGKNFNFILDDLVKKKQIPISAKYIINNELIKVFFPKFLINGSTNFKNDKAIIILFFTYYNNRLFWKKIILPLVLIKIKQHLKSFNKILQKIKKSNNEQSKLEFNSLGINPHLGRYDIIKNPHYISIGDNFFSLDRLRIEAWDEYQGEHFTPQIIIGNNVCFNSDIHIGCISKIEIGDNCLFGSRIYITDHDHGDTSVEDIKTPPAQRKLKSKGPVFIEKNVYIGEGVAILSGVRIGENSIIATNAVVTKDVPKNSVVAGIPAKIIKTINTND